MHDDVLTTYVHGDGTPVKPGVCIQPDHYETVFAVRVRSLQPLSDQQLQDVIQSKYEVVTIARLEKKCVVRNSP